MLFYNHEVRGWNTLQLILKLLLVITTAHVRLEHHVQYPDRTVRTCTAPVKIETLLLMCRFPISKIINLLYTD